MTEAVLQPTVSGAVLYSIRREVMALAKSARSSKPSKAALSRAGKTLANDGSSKAAKSKAGSTLGKG